MVSVHCTFYSIVPPTFREGERVVTFVKLSDSVEAAVTRLEVISGAAFDDEADVRRFGVVQLLDAGDVTGHEAFVSVLGDAFEDTAVQSGRGWL